MITVIADDITGAAEIAGIAKSAGFNTKLLMFGTTLPIENSKPSSLLLKTNSTLPNEVLVFATDTRQMSEAAAVREIEALLDRIGPESLLFKKTDSVLRGNISAECDAILRKTAYEQVLLVPQNPTKGRVVHDGLYYINNVLLTETQFADDPEFPARTAEVASFGVPDAENEEQIMQLVAAAKPKTLFAGGADLFRVIVQQLSPPPPPPTGRESLKDSL
ncbi:MAG: hypothetical protein HUK07_09030, partial [Bacteroidaceae bacterium]|nr:hypothetical protein [Bacteroidaceae bacterium]